MPTSPLKRPTARNGCELLSISMRMRPFAPSGLKLREREPVPLRESPSVCVWGGGGGRDYPRGETRLAVRRSLPLIITVIVPGLSIPIPDPLGRSLPDVSVINE